MKLKTISLSNALVALYYSVLLIYVYASATGFSVRLVIAFSFVCSLLFMFLTIHISITTGEKLWLICAVYMLVWTKRFEADVVYYDVLFLLTIFTMIVLQSKELNIKRTLVTKILVAYSFATVLLVNLELLFKSKMTTVISYFLSGTALIEEITYIQAGTGLRGLASSTNAVSLAAYIVLIYSLYFLDLNKGIKKVILIVLSFVALVVCGERSNFIFVPLALVCTYLVKNNGNNGVKYIKVIFTILCFWGVIMIFKPQLEQISALKRTFKTIDMLMNGNEITGERTILYNTAIQMWKEKPLFGYGWFEYYYQNVGIIKDGSFSHTHNLVLESLAECGIIGSLFIMTPIIYTIVSNLRLLRLIKSDKLRVREVSMLSFSLSFQLFFILDSLLHLTFFSQRIILYIISLFIFYNTKRSVRYKTYEE